MKNSIQFFIQFFLFLFYFNFSFGQISLQETDFANPNDTVRYSQAMDQGIDFSTTGTNNTWNFSSQLQLDNTLKTSILLGLVLYLYKLLLVFLLHRITKQVILPKTMIYRLIY